MPVTTFLGVYATNELPSALGASLRPMVKRKRFWFVWESDDGAFTVQPLNAIFEPMAEPRQITFREFEARYTPEPTCTTVPQTESTEERRGEERVSLAELERGAAEASYMLRADDPNLLRTWLETPPQRPYHGDFSPVQQAELARIVGETLPGEEPEPAVSCAPAQGEPLQEHELRSCFALGLLHIKQGQKKEGEGMLTALITNPNVNPYDGQMVFSEFGLQLRRLGLAQLALKAHQRALEWMPNDERVHFNLARTYHDLNQIDHAIRHLRRALELAPDFAVASQFLSFLEGKVSS